MGWKVVRKLGQWVAGIVGLVDAVVWVREMLTRPDRDIYVEMLGSIVSLHSLYLGAATGGAVVALGCAWPVARWVIGIPKRWDRARKIRSPSNQFRNLRNIIVREFNLIEQDEQFLSSSFKRSQPTKYSQREILRFELSKLEIKTPSPSSDNDHVWYDFVTNLVPLSQHARLEEARSLWLNFSDELGENRGRQ